MIFDPRDVFRSKINSQIAMVAACRGIAPSILRDISMTLRSELLDADVNAARSLRKAKHLRAAGVVCGVALETHFADVCRARQISLPRRDPGIGDYNEALRNAGVYDVPTWRLIQRLADIRNICGHKKERDPTDAEVEDLIVGTDKVLKEVG